MQPCATVATSTGPSSSCELFCLSSFQIHKYHLLKIIYQDVTRTKYMVSYSVVTGKCFISRSLRNSSSKTPASSSGVGPSGPRGLYLPLTLLAWRCIDVGASGHGFVNRHEILIPFIMHDSSRHGYAHGSFTNKGFNMVQSIVTGTPLPILHAPPTPLTIFFIFERPSFCIFQCPS